MVSQGRILLHAAGLSCQVCSQPVFSVRKKLLRWRQRLWLVYKSKNKHHAGIPVLEKIFSELCETVADIEKKIRMKINCTMLNTTITGSDLNLVWVKINPPKISLMDFIVI